MAGAGVLLGRSGKPVEPEPLQIMLDALPGYALLVDEHHYILMLNRRMTDQLGTNSAHAVGGYCPRIVHGCDGPFPGCPLEKAAADNLLEATALMPGPAPDQWLDSEVHLTAFRTAQGGRVYLHTTTDVSRREHQAREIERRAREQEALHDLLMVDAGGDMGPVLQRILERLVAIPWLSIERKGAIFLVDEDRDELVMQAAVGLAPTLLERCKRIAPGHCICGRALASRQAVFASQVDARHDVQYPGMLPHGHYCLPISHEGRCLGVLNTYVQAGSTRNASQEAFLRSAASVVATILARQASERDRQHSSAQLQASLEATIRTIGRVLETRDPYTADHQGRVAELSVAIGRRLGLDEHEQQGLELAASIHDIGKIGIPSELLTKPGKLAPVEMAIIRTHPTRGREILEDIELPWPIADMVAQHHEALDGTGYPAGLSGDEILLGSRILAVADLVEAISSDRPYRPTLGLKVALRELDKNRWTRFDGRVIDALEALIATGEGPAWLGQR